MKVTAKQPRKTTTVIVKTKPTRGKSNANPSASSYLRLLSFPFDNSAFGAKVSDPYSSYTNAYRLHGEFKVVAPVGTTTAAYIIKPNPFCSVIDVQSWSGAASTSSAAGWHQMTANSPIFSASTPVALDAVMGNYRVVAHAIRIRLEIPQNLATGRLIVARAPRSRADPAYSLLDNIVFQYAFQTSSNAPISTYPANPIANSPFLLETPESQEFSMIDLMGNDVVIINNPNSFEAFKFCDIPQKASVNPADIEGDDNLFDGTGIASAFGRIDNTAGWDDFYLYFDGLPSTGVPIANIEYILHLEGTPAISSGTDIVAIPSHPPTIPGTFIGFDAIHKFVATTAKIVFTDAPTAYNNITGGRNLLKDVAHGVSLASRRNNLRLRDL